MGDPLILLEIEERLDADRTGELRTGMLGQLLVLQQTLAARRRMLNDRQTYLEILAAAQAVGAAITVLRTVQVSQKKA